MCSFCFTFPFFLNEHERVLGAQHCCCTLRVALSARDSMHLADMQQDFQDPKWLQVRIQTGSPCKLIQKSLTAPTATTARATRGHSNVLPARRDKLQNENSTATSTNGMFRSSGITAQCPLQTINERQWEAFPCEDNCRKHMRKVHRFSEEQVRICDMDEETKRVRRGRKMGRRVETWLAVSYGA
jgi:hypothetical protein